VSGIIGIEFLAVFYALLGYGIFLYVAYKYYIFLAIRWGVHWGPELTPLARRATLLAGLPLGGVGLMILTGALTNRGDVAQSALYLSVFALAGLTVYQAWALARQYRDEERELHGRNGKGETNVVGDDDGS
jgi:hypothetical protein